MRFHQVITEAQLHGQQQFAKKRLDEVFSDPKLFDQFVQPFGLIVQPEIQQLKEAADEIVDILGNNYQMPPEEIEYIFRYIDQNHDSRNLAGKAVDKANQIRGTLRSIDQKILTLLKGKNPSEVQNFDQFMDQAQSKLDEADPSGKSRQWLEKYRAFAKKHPLTQAAITVIIAIVMNLATAGIAWWAPAVSAFVLKTMFARLEGLNWKQSAYKGAKAATVAGLLTWAMQPGTGLPDAATASDAAAAGGDAATAAADATSYTIASGDTLSQIAQKFGTSVELLIRDNPGLQGINPDQIRPGMTLTIPSELADVYTNAVGTSADTVQKLQSGELKVRWGDVPQAIQKAISYGVKSQLGESKALFTTMALASVYRNTVFTESQVCDILDKVERMVLREAPEGLQVNPIDVAKRRFTDRAGRFITSKNTLGKLKSSWDVDDTESTAYGLQNFLQRRGIPNDMILRAFNAV